ncbi:MAG TPA: DUF6788 family protein, partial [Candidatus Saccharimonadales bacterium]|nr:DUF6788 family protein [Candidatus Saccharimonadales bacterium]
HFKNASDLSLQQRKSTLLATLHIPSNAIRASRVRQFLTCGKKNCRCHDGRRHGPFHYLVQCMGVGSIRKFLLKTPAQRKEAEASITAYGELQKGLEELSQINTELLRRGLALDEWPRRRAG